jgi:hypothetical protein
LHDGRSRSHFAPKDAGSKEVLSAIQTHRNGSIFDFHPKMVQLYGLRQKPLKSLGNGFICGLKKIEEK